MLLKVKPGDQYDKHVQSVLDFNPNILIDDGADLTVTLHQRLGILDKNLKPIKDSKIKNRLRHYRSHRGNHNRRD